jgi:hypothetical protein
MSRPNLLTFCEAAELLGTDYRTISGVVRTKGITPKLTGLPGKANRTGLDQDDVRILRIALAPICTSSR